MAINLTVEQFENLNLYSNRNMEKVLGNLINKSSNGALVNMGEDSVILLDHEEGQFYIADYSFDRDNLSLKFENFDPIELERDEETFEESVYDYFEDDDSDVIRLTEAYKSNVMSQDKFINELVNDAMSRKNFEEVTNYEDVVTAKEGLQLESVNLSVFKKYQERLETHPLTEIKRFDWKNPVVVSLVETDSDKIINRSIIEKANDLWKNPKFKASFIEATEEFVEDVEEGAELYKGLFEEYPQVFFLDGGDRKALFGKAILSSSLRENMNDILTGLDLLFEKYDLADMRSNLLAEAEEEGMDVPAADEAEPEADDAPEEVDTPDMEKMVADLKKIAEKSEDEATKKKLDDLIQKMEKGKNEGTRPSVVKEAVSILSL